MTAKTLMIQGSSSSAGKSLLVTALCRIYARRGIKVAPFKAQNMSNNAAVCADGSEIGRAQALQAVAAKLAPTVDMNPVLIKPEADSRSQIVLMGRPWKTLEAKTYYEKKQILWEHVTQSLDRLRAEHELVIIEGAGSPAELNLRYGDIVNMAVAQYAKSPVLLIGDIDRGGIFAQLLGTLWLLEPDERALIRGFVVNKFRGDLSLFEDGIQIIEQKGGIPVLGVVPYLKGLSLPDEDAVSVEAASLAAQPASPAQTDIAILALPRIANFDDFDALRAEPGVHIRHVDSASQLGTPHAIIIPGTKSTMADLNWLRQTGLADAIIRFAKQGGAVVGICGGYQMLGQSIHDPLHVESHDDSMHGLELLPLVTTFAEKKATHQVDARILGFSTLAGETITGYEIHAGETHSKTQWLEIFHRNGEQVSVKDGAVSPNGKVWGCYLHGLFQNDNFRHAWLKSLGWQGEASSQSVRFEESLEALADAVESALNMPLLEKIIWER
ncbi:MAG: cobyric acid synthase [Anaerolineales bacterium]|uniref:cobyric acid synthase n=1 Tax=Candidatus Villigracilis vicinus TaxID=3140679 RepID=UPI0031368C17|nr:cobyric acid synthase [Anaerolineales bacterium]